MLAFRSGKPTTADPSGAVPGTELAADRAAVVAGGVGVLAAELVGEDRPAPLREALLSHLADTIKDTGRRDNTIPTGTSYI